MDAGTAELEAATKATLLRLRRASIRRTGCHLTAEMVDVLANSFLGEAIEIAAGNIASAEQD